MATALRSSDFCDLWYMVIQVWSCTHVKMVPELRTTRKRQKIWATKSVRVSYGYMPCTVLTLSLAGRAALSHAIARNPFSTTTVVRSV